MFTREGWILVFGVVGFFGSIFGLAFMTDAMGCHARWSGSGYEASYGILSDCTVHIKGRWMPEKSLRALGQD